MVTLFRSKSGSTRQAWRLGAAVAALAVASPASADYIGPSYLKVPGVEGGSFKGKYDHWIRAEANYWGERPGRREIRGISGKESGLKFTGPRTPANGASMLALAVDKKSPGLVRLMELCRSGAEAWAAESGNRVKLVSTPADANERLALYQSLLAAGSTEIDVFQIDVVWPGILASHFIDLAPYIPAEERDGHFPVLIDNNTVDGALVACVSAGLA